jgi:hypothetical protein
LEPPAVGDRHGARRGEIVAATRGFDSPQKAAKATDVAEAHIRVALAYREAFPQEIDDAIAGNSRPLEQLRREYPAIDTVIAE